MKRKLLAASLAWATLPAAAVTLNPDGLGQALVFPYYDTKSSQGNAFNTYVSIVNHTAQAKAVRVRFRENRASKEVASFNLYLSPNDVWTGAVLPLFDAGTGARLFSADRSCVSPAFTADVEHPPGVNFQNTLYSGAFDDGNGTGLDRTREGWIEVIEMATVTGASAAAISHNSAGVPVNCAAVQGNAALEVAAPTGGLSGTLTLINVSTGMDFAVNADALADLGTRAFYRPAGDPYPDLNAGEIDPVSTVVSNGFIYRSTWNRPIDAVSAVFMRVEAAAEYVLDSATKSNTDIVINFPTRHFYASTVGASAPFSAPSRWSNVCTAAGEPLQLANWNREEALGVIACDTSPCPPPPPPPTVCAAVNVIGVRNGAAHMFPSTAESVLGAVDQSYRERFSSQVLLSPTFQNGWLRAYQQTPLSLTSLATSQRMSIATGATTTGAHAYSGLPMTGFAVRTLLNGNLTCGAGTCQGNYGGAFPFKYRRSIAPAS